MREEVQLNGVNSGQGIVNEIKDFTEFNDIKLPSSENNMFANASFVAHDIKPRQRKIMCTKVSR